MGIAAPYSLAAQSPVFRQQEVVSTQPPAAESKRPATGTASGDDYNDDVMLTFERAPKSRTPKFSSS
jgi:hypothetical protein